MTRHRNAWIRRLAVVLGSGWIMSLSCVQNMGEVVSAGLHTTTGVAQNALGAGLNVISDVVRLGPGIF